MELPSHPEADDATTVGEPAPAGRRATVLVAALLGALLVVIVVLHVTGVMGPAGN